MFALYYIIVSKKTSVPKSAPSSRGLRVPRDRNTLYRYDSKLSQSVPSYEAPTPQSLDAPEVLPTPTLDDAEPMEIGSIRSKLSKGEREQRRGCGLCFYCGVTGHLISLCPTCPPRPKFQQVGTTRILPVTPESLPAIQLKVPVPQSDVPVPAARSDVPVPMFQLEFPVLVSPLPPDCTYASNGTIVRKQDLKIFERALRAMKVSPAGTSKTKKAQRKFSKSSFDLFSLTFLTNYLFYALRTFLRGGNCHGSYRALQTARRGHTPSGSGWY